MCCSWGYGEIGSRARFRFWWRDPCQFESDYPHQKFEQRSSPCEGFFRICSALKSLYRYFIYTNKFSMSGHLQVLMSIFPGKIFLDVEDIAKCLGQSKGHIYNLSSAKKLPFQLEWGLGDKIQVSIVEMAKYLDSKLEPKKEEPPAALASPVYIEKKKVGRPRGPRTTKIQLAFQAQLQVAIIKYEFRYIISEMEASLNEIEFDASEGVPCSQKFDGLKNESSALLFNAKTCMNRAFSDLIIPFKPKREAKVKKQ